MSSFLQKLQECLRPNLILTCYRMAWVCHHRNIWKLQQIPQTLEKQTLQLGAKASSQFRPHRNQRIVLRAQRVWATRVLHRTTPRVVLHVSKQT